MLNSKSIRLITILTAALLLAGCGGYASALYEVRVSYQKGNKEKVTTFLQSSDVDAREEAVSILPKMKECTPQLFAMAADSEPKVRASLAKSLKHCTRSPDATNTLVTLMKDPNAVVRKNTAESAVANDYCRDECYFGLRTLLNDEDMLVKLAAAKAIYKRFPSEAHDTTIASLSSKTYVVKREALEVLPLFQRSEDLAYYMDFLKDPDQSIRILARKGIESSYGRLLTADELDQIVSGQKTTTPLFAASAPVALKTSKQLPQGEVPKLSEFHLHKTKVVAKDAIAVIIGNSNYSSTDIPNVDYAIRDADVMKQVAQDVLGVPVGNIIYIANAKSSDFNKIFGTESNPEGLLANWAKPDSDIFVYYSGHGSPDPKTREAYFVPVDSDINYIALSGYPVKQLYRNLAMLHAKSITVVLDACFSGLTHAGTITKSASPVFVNVTNPLATSDTDVTIISSSRSNEISTWDDEHKYGLFTYTFVKGLREADKNHDGRVTVQEMEEYLTQNVSYTAKRLMNREQNPQVVGIKSKVLAELKD